jgi:uncharacterized repeat protein (TIGR02543 family)
VTILPKQTSYAYGAQVQLTAVPTNGYTFTGTGDGWTGDLSGTTNPTTVTITKNTAITATFSKVTATTLIWTSWASTTVIGQSYSAIGLLSTFSSSATIRIVFTRPDGSQLVTTTTSLLGVFYATTTPDAIGTWTVAAQYLGDSTHGASTTSSVSFQVTKMTSTTSCSVTPTTVANGQSITVSGIVSPASGSAISGETVTLKFTAPDGSTFSGPAVTSSSGSYSYPFTPNIIGSWSVVASFAEDSTHLASASASQAFTVAAPISITITSSPTGTGYVTVDSVAITTPQTFSWVPGTTHTIAASSTVSISSGVRDSYASWSDGGAQSHSYTVPSTAATATANFNRQYQVTFTRGNLNAVSGSTTVVTVGSTAYSYSTLGSSGDTIWVTSGTTYTYSNTVSSSTSGEQFILTSVSGTASPITGTGTVTPVYQVQYKLTMATNFGTVSPTTGTWYNAGSTVTIQATAPSVGAGEQYVFNGWTGSGTGSYTGANNPQTITMNGVYTETASWTHQYQVTFVASPSGAGTTSPTGSSVWENAGSLSISATVNTGYLFSQWQSSTGSITFTSASSKSTTATIGGTGTITATFTQAVLAKFVFGSISSKTAGTAFSVTITAEDAGGNTLTGYTGTVHFTSTDGQAVLPGDYTFTSTDSGVHTFTNGFTLKTAGSQTITVRDAAASVSTTSSSITVSAASVSKLVYTVGTSQTVAHGVRSTVITVQRQDAYGNAVTSGGSLTVNLSSSSSGGKFYASSGSSTAITSVSISSGSSSANFYYQDSTAGSPTITAASGTLTSATTTFTIT